MKIIKYKKIKDSKYIVYIDDEKIELYEDIIIKYNLLLKKTISKEELTGILNDNNDYYGYMLAIKYITKKIRSEKEIREYLLKKEIDKDNINRIVELLRKNKYIDDISFVKAYTLDKFNINNYGPNKIKKKLRELNIDNNIIDDYVCIDNELINEKLNKLIDKKIKSIRNYSNNVLKNKVVNYFMEQGFEKSDILIILDNKDLSKDDLYKKEYDKLYNKYSKKYSGFELEMIIKQKLYQKGFIKK